MFFPSFYILITGNGHIISIMGFGLRCSRSSSGSTQSVRLSVRPSSFCPLLPEQRQGQIMYFHVNASPPKPLEVAVSNFAAA